MEYNPYDGCLYLALSGTISDSLLAVKKQINTISVWSLDLSNIWINYFWLIINNIITNIKSSFVTKISLV